MKEKIKNYAKEIGADDIGFTSIGNYKSPNSIPIKEIFKDAKTIIVLAFQQIDNCESENDQFASVGIKMVTEFSHSCAYKTARFIKKEFKARAMVVPGSVPVNIDKKTRLPSGYVSLRHAAFAAGLGNFGRHNLIIHPKMGSKVVFTAIVTDIEIQPDTPIKENLCINCDICVNQCPVNALDEERKTDVMKCMFNSQPYGFGGYKQFWTKFFQSNPEEQKIMIQDEKMGKLHQAMSLGSQYVCFNCTKSCPAGQ
ncbi:MAG TPA: 4Fe-4S binding protein [Methanobacterium sp.]|nr:4Fe-4S binding protein [Methanobacterium sp.]